MNRNAARAAIKFLSVGVIAIGWMVAVAFGDGNPFWRVFMYTVAAGVIIKMIWPSQDEGEALLKEVRND